MCVCTACLHHMCVYVFSAIGEDSRHKVEERLRQFEQVDKVCFYMAGCGRS